MCCKCGEIIESKYRHDYQTCKCGSCSVDGGHDYLRRCAKSRDAFIEMSEIEGVEERGSKAKTEAMKLSLSMQDPVIPSHVVRRLEKQLQERIKKDD